MNRTTINWVLGPDGAQGWSWNCFAGCSPNKVSPGCANCWAERLAATRLAHLPTYKGLTRPTVGAADHAPIAYRWTGEVRFFAEKLAEPLRRRKPSGIFVGDMGDIALLPNEQIAAIFGVMAACPQHRFYVLTKRPERLREWFEWVCRRGRVTEAYPAWLVVQQEADDHVDLPNGSMPFPERPWPLPNVWIGASASTQADLDRVAPELLRIPAAVRFLSLEPLLESVDIFGTPEVPGVAFLKRTVLSAGDPQEPPECEIELHTCIDWVIAGGESGSNARPCHVDWLRSIVRQCRAAGVPPWVKQLGAHVPVESGHDENWKVATTMRVRGYEQKFVYALRDRAGSEMAEWPEDLRCREMPEVAP